MQLGVNVDHVATLRQARGTSYPDPVEAARIAVAGGADQITVHLREDRRHIQDVDVRRIREELNVPLNLEMAATPWMRRFAEEIQPQECCIVPEKREELTTEGGLNAAADVPKLGELCRALVPRGIAVSLFIDPEPEQIDAGMQIGAPIVELHTGRYAEADDPAMAERELEAIRQAVNRARHGGLQVNAGHGLNYENVQPVAALPGITCLNIGHAIIARSVTDGMAVAVSEMKRLMQCRPA
ncbi:MAG: Pyridoxine 5'-phosphate synthase [Gammaproteobacteria bacterium]|nr:Pyridoxine 5'-phosphate synthase [Gammaproteobacteria bacterium]